jgi:hypothetical protein
MISVNLNDPLSSYLEHAILEDQYSRMRKVLRGNQFSGVIPRSCSGGVCKGSRYLHQGVRRADLR